MLTGIGSKEEFLTPQMTGDTNVQLKEFILDPRLPHWPVCWEHLVDEVGGVGGGWNHFKLVSWVGKEDPCCNPNSLSSQSQW